MAYCSKCGNWMPDNAMMCNVCGTRVPQQSAQPQQRPSQYTPPQYNQQYQQPQYQQPQYPTQGQSQYPTQGQSQYPTQGQSRYPSQGQYPPQGPYSSQGQYPPQYQQPAQPIRDTSQLGQTRTTDQLGWQPPTPPTPPAPPVPPEPPKKKKKGLKIALFILLGVVLAAALGIGGYFLWDHFQEEPPEAGRYNAVSCTVDGEEVDTDGEWIELSKGGKAEIHMSDKTFDAKWKLDGSDITITQQGDKYTGTLEDNLLTIDLEGMLFVFRKEGTEEEPQIPDVTPAPSEDETVPSQDETDPSSGEETAPPEESTLPPEESTAPGTETQPEKTPTGGLDTQWWTGEWYGWWVIWEGTGNLEEDEDVAADVCAQITLSEDGTGKLSMWDQENGLMQTKWDVNVVLVEGSDERGLLTARSGTFKNAPIPENDWTIDPTEIPFCHFEKFLFIHGTYQNPYIPEDHCEYMVFLRPWGQVWEDVRGGDMSEMPYTDMMPILYEDWYLPLIQAGKGMPDRFYRN